MGRKKYFEIQVKELGLKEQKLEARVKEFEIKEHEFKGQLKELESDKMHFESQLKELKLKEDRLGSRVKEFESKEVKFNDQLAKYETASFTDKHCVREEATRLVLNLKAYIGENTENSVPVLGFLHCRIMVTDKSLSFVAVTDVHGRTFGTWTLLTCTRCYICAFNLDNKPIYVALYCHLSMCLVIS
ncbi:ergosterol biosynthetic protein [Trifolium repens]|nr:ergosterol biosynthetic protein [Trifolium repens]